VGVLLHANYRLRGPNGEKIVMPAPIDKDTPHAPWWWDHLAGQAADFKRCGFSAVLLPPVCKSQSGAAPDADGYGLFDNYDIGSKNQVYNKPTRYGDDERLRRMIGVMHACGLEVYGDVVLHQYDGGNNGTYRYVGADGKTLNGRFPKHPSCFVGNPPRVAVDPVADPQGNFAFGDMVSYLHATPKNYMLDGAIDAVDWLTRTLDLEGYRIDDVKGMAVQAVRDILNAKSMAGRFAVGEYFDGNASALHWWVWDSGMGGRCNVFDFTLHWTIQAMCNNSSRWFMGGLQGAGYIAANPMNAITFVDNPDTDLSDGENVIWNKLLGYALILTAEGYPSVYYKDYSPDPGCYGLKPAIDNLIWIHENLAFGSTATRWGNDGQVYVFERQGYPGLLVGLNNDQWNAYTRTVQTSFGPNVQLHDYAGHHADVWTRVTCASPAWAMPKGSHWSAARRRKPSSVRRTSIGARRKTNGRYKSDGSGARRIPASTSCSSRTRRAGARRQRSSWKCSMPKPMCWQLKPIGPSRRAAPSKRPLNNLDGTPCASWGRDCPPPAQAMKRS
jgi:alpha-amylase